MKMHFLVTIAFLPFLALPGPASDDFWFGDFYTEVKTGRDPAAATIDKDGKIYVVLRGESAVAVYTRDGKQLFSWGGYGRKPGRFSSPGGIAIGDGLVYIADTGNQRIQVFDKTGRRKRVWGSLGQDEGQFNQPIGIAVGGGRVYVADRGNNRVQVFDREGTFQLALHSGGEMAFSRPSAVAAATDGTLYVADTDNNRIVVFNQQGSFQASWGDWGVFPGLLDEPTGLVWDNQRLLVCDRRNHRVQAFNKNGEMQRIWGVHERIPHEGGGKLHYPDAVAIAPSGAFAVVVEAIEDRFQVFSNLEGEDAPYEASLNAGKNRTHYGQYPAIDGALLAIVEPENHFVYLYDTKANDIPIHINQFGERGRGFGLLVRPSGVSVDLTANAVFVSDLVNQRVQEYRMTYDPQGELRYIPDMTRFVGAIDFSRLDESVPGNRWPLQANLIKKDPHGRICLLDARNRAVYVFDRDWTFLHPLGERGRGQLQKPTDLVFSPTGDRLFVVDAQTAKVKSYDREGRYRKSFGKKGVAPGAFLEPFGIAADSAGFLYVTDRGAGSISKFTARGRFVARWGTRGDGMGQLWKPAGLVVDSRDRLIVIDFGNHRGQIFSTSGKWLVTFGAGRAYTWKRPPMERKN